MSIKQTANYFIPITSHFIEGQPWGALRTSSDDHQFTFSTKVSIDSTPFTLLLLK